MTAVDGIHLPDRSGRQKRFAHRPVKPSLSALVIVQQAGQPRAISSAEHESTNERALP